MSQIPEEGTLAPPPADATEARILDAAYAQVMAVGFRRTTLTDVAERAGLSRMTVYRRFPDVTSVLQALMMREFAWMIGEAGVDGGDGPARREEIVASALRGLELIRSHDLFVRLLDVDPELLLPYMTHRPGRFQDAAAEVLAGRLHDAMDVGSVRRDDPARLARSMLLAMRGYAYAARVPGPRSARALAIEDLERMLDGLLRPEAP